MVIFTTSTVPRNTEKKKKMPSLSNWQFTWKILFLASKYIREVVWMNILIFFPSVQFFSTPFRLVKVPADLRQILLSIATFIDSIRESTCNNNNNTKQFTKSGKRTRNCEAEERKGRMVRGRLKCVYKSYLVIILRSMKNTRYILCIVVVICWKFTKISILRDTYTHRHDSILSLTCIIVSEWCFFSSLFGSQSSRKSQCVYGRHVTRDGMSFCEAAVFTFDRDFVVSFLFAIPT